MYRNVRIWRPGNFDRPFAVPADRLATKLTVCANTPMFPPPLLTRLHSRFTRERFLRKERLLSRLWSREPLRILFSPQEAWEPVIRAGFAHTRHSLEFASLSGRDFSRYDLVVPLSVPDTLVLSAQRHALAHTLIPIPDARSVHLCNDKYLLNRELGERGFSQFVPAMLDRPVVPFMLKARVAENSERCYIVHDAQTRAMHEHLIGSPDYFCQQLVMGRSEFAAHVLLAGGRVVTETTIEYVADRDAFIKMGATFHGRKIVRCAFTPLFERMLVAIGFEGLCCINYKVVDGRPMVLEINPRFGGSLSPLFFAFIRHLPTARQWALEACGGPGRSVA